jgi:CheY-like chemotaxis protein
MNARPDFDSATRPGAAAERTLRVLIVDDNRDAAVTLGELLEIWGLDVRVVHSGQEGLAAAEQLDPHLVLLDIGLPGMDGYTVARHLRSADDTAGCVIAAVTGYGQDSDRQRSREAGIDHHLVKPVSLADLKRLLRETGTALDCPGHAVSELSMAA